MAERAACGSHGGGFLIDTGVRIEAADRAGLEPMQPDKYSGELVLTPLKLINRIAQRVPPPHTHRHRYYGLLPPNSPLHTAVTAMARR